MFLQFCGEIPLKREDIFDDYKKGIIAMRKNVRIKNNREVIGLELY